MGSECTPPSRPLENLMWCARLARCRESIPSLREGQVLPAHLAEDSWPGARRTGDGGRYARTTSTLATPFLPPVLGWRMAQIRDLSLSVAGNLHLETRRQTP
jgi:hypothetical protein